EFDLEAASAALRPLIPKGLGVDEVAVRTAGTAALVPAIDAGRLLVNFAGHGSVESWTKHASFGTDEAAGLVNGAALPFVVSMTCLNGLFDDVFSESLAEAFLKAPNGGAAAVWASSGLTEPEPQSALNQELFRRLFRKGPVRLGDAVRRAKAAVDDGDVRRTWILFGDPTMTLR
ncbi:MAG: C25 family cysteine peptidase, partial [Betaproteobacteria bacterium]